MSMTFPKFEMFEFGSQFRRSSNSVPANIAECYNNQHANIYMECLSRSIGEAQESQHHLCAIYERNIYRRRYFEILMGDILSVLKCYLDSEIINEKSPFRNSRKKIKDKFAICDLMPFSLHLNGK